MDDCQGLLLFSDVVDSIRLDHVGVPSYAIQGKQAVLECPYDLEGSSLYSVKWYKNGREFFRYVQITRLKCNTDFYHPNNLVFHIIFCEQIRPEINIK